MAQMAQRFVRFGSLGILSASKTQKTKILLNVVLDWYIQPFIFSGSIFLSHTHIVAMEHYPLT